jgi:hypothetical protein
VHGSFGSTPESPAFDWQGALLTVVVVDGSEPIGGASEIGIGGSLARSAVEVRSLQWAAPQR